jgi:hypothetical protein
MGLVASSQTLPNDLADSRAMPLPAGLCRIWWRWRSGASHCRAQPCRLLPTGGVFLECSSSLSVRHRLRITIGSAARTPSSPMRAPWKKYVRTLSRVSTFLGSKRTGFERKNLSSSFVSLCIRARLQSCRSQTKRNRALAPAVARPARNTKFESNFSLSVALLGREKTAGAKAQHCFRPVRHD